MLLLQPSVPRITDRPECLLACRIPGSAAAQLANKLLAAEAQLCPRADHAVAAARSTSVAYIMHDLTWSCAALGVLIAAACLGGAPCITAALAQQADTLFVAVMLLHLIQPQLLGLARLAQRAFGKACATCSDASSLMLDAHLHLCRIVWFLAAAASSMQLAQMLRLLRPTAAGSSPWVAVSVVGALCRVLSCGISVAPSHSMSLRHQYLLDLLGGAAALAGAGISLVSLATRLGLRALAAAMQLATVSLWVSMLMEGRTTLSCSWQG